MHSLKKGNLVKYYEQTNPIPAMCVAQIANQASEKGWELVSTMPLGIMPKNNSIITAPKPKDMIPVVSCIFSCIPLNGGEIPEFPQIQVTV